MRPPPGSWLCYDPVKLTVTNYPQGHSETFQVENNPVDPAVRYPAPHLLPGAVD